MLARRREVLRLNMYSSSPDSIAIDLLTVPVTAVNPIHFQISSTSGSKARKKTWDLSRTWVHLSRRNSSAHVSSSVKFIILNTEFLVFDTQFLVFNTKSFVFTHVQERPHSFRQAASDCLHTATPPELRKSSEGSHKLCGKQWRDCVFAYDPQS